MWFIAELVGKLSPWREIAMEGQCGLYLFDLCIYLTLVVTSLPFAGM